MPGGGGAGDARRYAAAGKRGESAGAGVGGRSGRRGRAKPAASAREISAAQDVGQVLLDALADLRGLRDHAGSESTHVYVRARACNRTRN